VQGILGRELAEFEEVGDAAGVLQLLVDSRRDRR
jgi:hypothetical protein